MTEEEIIPTQEVAVAQKSTLTPSKVDENLQKQSQVDENLQKQSQVDENLQKQSQVDENLQKQSHEIETLLENFGSNEVNGIEEVVENFDTEDGKTESRRDSPASVRRLDDEKNSSIGRGSSRKDEDSFHKRKFVSKYEDQAQSPSKQAIVVSLCLHPALVQLLLHVPVSDFLITYLLLCSRSSQLSGSRREERCNRWTHLTPRKTRKTFIKPSSDSVSFYASLKTEHLLNLIPNKALIILSWFYRNRFL